VASRTESTVVNAAGLVQDIVLVTFPALSTIFTKPTEYGLSSSQYGGLFLPQVITAITASLLGAELARRISTKRVYLIGLACSTIAMGLLIASAGVKTDQPVAYPLLLVLTAFLGAGFGRPCPCSTRMSRCSNRTASTARCWCSTRSSAWARHSRRCS
jgi:MFS family permease